MVLDGAVVIGYIARKRGVLWLAVEGSNELRGNRSIGRSGSLSMTTEVTDELEFEGIGSTALCAAFAVRTVMSSLAIAVDFGARVTFFAFLRRRRETVPR